MVRTQDAGNKVLNIFNRLKRRANQSPSTFELVQSGNIEAHHRFRAQRKP